MQKKEDLPLLAIRYTADGEVCSRNVHGTYIDDPLRTVELGILPGFIGEEHRRWMDVFYCFLRAMRERSPNRDIPLTRKEVLTNGFDRRALKELCQAALLKETLMPIQRKKDGKMTGARAVIYFTPQGRAYIRKFIDPDYAVTDNT